MKSAPIIILFLLLFSSGICSAATHSNITQPPSHIGNLTNNVIKIDSKNETVVLTPEPGVKVTKSTHGTTGNISAGELMIQNALKNTAVDSVNGVISGVGGVQLGDLNDTESRDGSEVAVFAIAAHTIDPMRDPYTMGQVGTSKNIYIYGILIFAAILALFLIYQQVDPDDSAKLLETATGTYGYVAISDMVKYFINTCGWLILGPALFFGAIKANNFLVEGQMLSVLDQVAFSSDSVGLYLIMGVLWLVSILFFAIRLVSIILSALLWYFYGIGFAFKKLRWLAILIVSYQIGIIFSQFLIVWTSCVIVDYTASQELAWYSVSFVYLGLFLTIVIEQILVLIWPILWKLLSPRSLTAAIQLVRYI